MTEKEYYVRTRILPILGSRGLDQWYPKLALNIDLMIEEAAQRPVQPDQDGNGKFVSNPEVFDPRMDPLDYEKYCAMQLEKRGWSARLTPATGDQEADIVASRAGKSLVVQCKLYDQPVGNDAVQQVYAARTFQKADAAAVVSNQPYTKSAHQLASVNGVYLLHHEQLLGFEIEPSRPELRLVPTST